MSLNFIWIEDFLALAATGNFSRAAEDRHSSQPAFSRRIRALEDWLGTALVDRSTQPARLTEAGEWFRGVAQDLLARTSRLPAEARQVAQASAATLRIASTHALSFTFLPRWLRALEDPLALGPIELTSDVLERCEAQMQEGKVHFALAHAHAALRGSLDSDAYLHVTIGRDALWPVCAPTSDGAPLHRLDTAPPASVPLLAYTEASGMGRIVRAVLARKLAGVHGQVVFTAHLASVLRSMALDGRGIAWLPRTLVEEDVAAGRLAWAATSDWSVDLEVRLYRPREGISRAAQAFWELASAQRGPQDPEHVQTYG